MVGQVTDSLKQGNLKPSAYCIRILTCTKDSKEDQELKTRLTERLKIKYPIIQSPMAWVSYPPLVAAVSEAGGLGILAGGRMTPEELRQAIREVREFTDKPFGVNVTATSPRIVELAQVMCEERIAVASYGKGSPQPILAKCKPEGIVCMPTIGALSHLKKAEADGADAVIVQGLEAGGHCSFVGTIVLVPLVASEAKIPMAAAGGFCDGKGLVAALALGAEAMAMGTRFILTQESPVPLHIKQRLLQATEEDTIVTSLVTGILCRGLRGKIVDLLEEKGMEALGVPKDLLGHTAWGALRQRAAWVEGDAEMGFTPCSQVVGRIDDIPTCKELIERVMREAEEVLARIESRFVKQ